MSQIPEDLKYTKEHEWIKIDGNVAIVGITDHAQHELGDIVYVELPGVGDELVAEKSFGSIESVKAASDLFSPLSGKVTEINEALDAAPESVNKAPYEGGWMIKIELSNSDEVNQLLDSSAYGALVSNG